MLGFGVKLPVSPEIKLWADEAFTRLEALLGSERMIDATVILPEDRYFPDRYDGSSSAIQAMAKRVATYMGVEPESFRVEIYAEGEHAFRESIPLWSGKTSDAAGLYFHRPDDGRFLVGLHANQIADPVSAVATLAHELAHVILLGGGLLDPETEDMEPLTDICTVFLGMGFFTATSAFQFKQWTDTQTQGWSTQRKGYLTEALWAYALARFAKERGERKPAWVQGLPYNIRSYFKQSARWLETH
jgi:hypothetical protein